MRVEEKAEAYETRGLLQKCKRELKEMEDKYVEVLEENRQLVRQLQSDK